jgi:hypothetical protein
MRCVADASIATKMLRIVRGALCSAETQWICASYLLVEIEEHILNLFAREVAGGEHEHKGASARARVSSLRPVHAAAVPHSARPPGAPPGQSDGLSL